MYVCMYVCNVCACVHMYGTYACCYLITLCAHTHTHTNKQTHAHTHTHLHDPILVILSLSQSNEVIEENAVLGRLLLPHHLCQGALLHQTHVRVEDLQRDGTICHQLVQEFDFIQGVVPIRFLFAQILKVENGIINRMVCPVTARIALPQQRRLMSGYVYYVALGSLQ